MHCGTNQQQATWPTTCMSQNGSIERWIEIGLLFGIVTEFTGRNRVKSLTNDTKNSHLGVKADGA